MMSAKYFEYYTIILRGAFFRGQTPVTDSWVERLDFCHRKLFTVYGRPME